LNVWYEENATNQSMAEIHGQGRQGVRQDVLRLPTGSKPACATSASQHSATAWEYVAVDYLGPLPSGHYILVLVDYYSRYVIAHVTKSCTAEVTFKLLEDIFFELTRLSKLASDNGPCFAAKDFGKFLERWRVIHKHVTALWPQANGEVERQNSSLNERLKIAQATALPWKRELQRYLHAYNHGASTVVKFWAVQVLS